MMILVVDFLLSCLLIMFICVVLLVVFVVSTILVLLNIVFKTPEIRVNVVDDKMTAEFKSSPLVEQDDDGDKMNVVEI